ncbi:hypothetical protein [Symmachiella dynata]|uniref:hypothetical protein n=1 Tax=Symmachiella dynata TaxID=2527995 RepID=UPI0030EB8880
MGYQRRIVHYRPGPGDFQAVISDRAIAGCWFELHRQGGCGAGELRLNDRFVDRAGIEIGDWISMAYQTGDRWYLGRVEERVATSPAEISFRLQGMSVELGEVFPGGFSPDRADGAPPHRYARTDLFPHDPDRSLETVDAVSQPDEFVTLLLQQYVVPRTHITLDAAMVDAVNLADGVTTAKFRGEESVRSILKEEAVRAFNASWGVDAWGRFFFLQKRTSVIATFQEGVDVVALEESRDRDLLYNRVMLTGGYVYDEQLGSDIFMRGYYRWRGNYIQPASRDQHGERRIRIWIPWIRTESDSRQFVKEFFRVYAQPTSRYFVEVADQQVLPAPWGGRILIKDHSGAELISAMVETIRVQFDHAPRFRLEIGPEDPHTHWPEPPHDERWEIPGNQNQNGGHGGSELSFDSSDVGPDSTDASSSSVSDSTSSGMSSSLESSELSGGESVVETEGGGSSGDESESGGGESGSSDSGVSSGEESSGASESGESSGGGESGTGGENSSSSANDTCVEKTATDSDTVDDGGDEEWERLGGGRGEVSLGQNDSAQTLRCFDFNFSLPSGKTVVGITVTYNLECSNNAANDVVGGEVTVTSGSKSGTKSLFVGDGVWPDSETDEIVGSEGDTWGESWTTDDFNAFGLQVDLSAVEHLGNANTRTAEVNSVKLKVCYEE